MTDFEVPDSPLIFGSDAGSSPTLSGKKKSSQKSEQKDSNENVITLRRKVSDCEEYQLQACDNFSLDNKLLYNKFPAGFSKIEEVDEEEEANQAQSQVKKYYESGASDQEDESPNVHTYVSNTQLNCNSVSMKQIDSLEDDYFREAKKVRKQTAKQEQEDPRIYIVRNLDTGEEYDSRSNDIDSKFSYSSLVMKTTASQTHDSHQFNCSEVSILPTEQNWKQFWNKVKKNNLLLLDYCENGDLQKLQILLSDKQQIPTQVNFKSIDNWTALHFAASMGHHEVVKFLLQQGADPFSQSSMQRTPLHSAVIRGSLLCTQILVEKGGKKLIDVQDKDFNTALHLASENDQLQIVEYLIQNKANFSLKNHKNLSPFQLSISQEMRQIFQDYSATDTQEDYARLSVGGLVKRNNRADHVAKLLIMTQTVQKCQEQKKIQIIEEKQRLLKELSWKDFRFISKLGQGSFGEVYLVEREKKLFAMKIQNKQQVLQKNLQRYVQTEKKALSLFNHPFIIKLHYAFQNDWYLFMVMEYAEGGDMGNYLNKKNKLPEDEARIYTAQIVLALEELHKQDIIFRDLKPDNVVLDHLGNAKLTDFGLSKEGIKENTYTKSFCGSVAYLAPEVLAKRPHSRTVDWYLLGTFLYELLVGIPPYYDNNKEILYDNIRRGPLKIPRSMSADAKDLIKQLLNRNPKERLGSKGDSEEIKAHPFFKNVNWDDIYTGKVKAPSFEVPKVDIKPTLTNINFDNRPKQQDSKSNSNKNNQASHSGQQNIGKIDKWSYIS
ncbi:hypothetical protein ABPG73_000047 [Tetrahymena malaccensis]